MKLSSMLLASRVLDRARIRHFSDGDFVVPLNVRSGSSYIESLRIRRPVIRIARGMEAAAVRSAGSDRGGFRGLFR